MAVLSCPYVLLGKLHVCVCVYIHRYIYKCVYVNIFECVFVSAPFLNPQNGKKNQDTESGSSDFDRVVCAYYSGKNWR